jgi:hypothetical protein
MVDRSTPLCTTIVLKSTWTLGKGMEAATFRPRLFALLEAMKARSGCDCPSDQAMRVLTWANDFR